MASKVTLDGDEREQFQRFYEEFLAKPLDYVRHDANARLDESLRRGVVDHGLEFSGRWWVLVECLSAKHGHRYDVSDETGWRILALDLSTCGVPWGVDECKEFVGQLASLGLVNAELLDERHVVCNDRLCREVDGYATAAAGKKLGSWKTNKAKAVKDAMRSR